MLSAFKYSMLGFLVATSNAYAEDSYNIAANLFFDVCVEGAPTFQDLDFQNRTVEKGGENQWRLKSQSTIALTVFDDFEDRNACLVQIVAPDQELLRAAYNQELSRRFKNAKPRPYGSRMIAVVEKNGAQLFLEVLPLTGGSLKLQAQTRKGSS